MAKSGSEQESALTPEEAAASGMVLALHAQLAPQRMAVASAAGTRSFGELNARANQLVRALRARGVAPGAGVALLCSNRPEFVETMAACQRGGYRITPINWHLTGKEIGYIVDDCEAEAFLADARFGANAIEAAALAPGARVKLAIGGAIDGFEPYEAAVEGQAGGNLSDPQLGSQMLYTSGTTGHPKGVYRRTPPGPSPLLEKLRETAAFKPGEDAALVTGPLYHAAPLALNLLFPLASGVGTVLMDKWDAEETLALIEKHRITHTHVVPTMMHRMAGLPKAVREKYDLSSLRWMLHGAAPCPVHVKEETIAWLGPVVFEYYAATEGGGVFIGPEEWLEKKGSVGRALPGVTVSIQDEAGRELPVGETGTVYFKAPDVGRFEYFKAPEKTEGAYRGSYFTMGDMGYIDEDGFIFLTGRSAELIISGGVNIYPAEIDQELLQHPAVADVATIGVPNEEWGEEVKAVVQVKEGIHAGPELAQELLAFAANRLPGFKRPRSIDFAEDLPRLPTGKIVRRQVRAPYWPVKGKSI